MDALRIRCSVLSLSSLDVLQRLEQALEASSRCTSSQEDLHLWLGRIERELLGAAGAQTHAGDAVLCAAERQRVMFSRNIKMKQSWVCFHAVLYITQQHTHGSLKQMDERGCEFVVRKTVSVERLYLFED